MIFRQGFKTGGSTPRRAMWRPYLGKYKKNYARIGRKIFRGRRMRSLTHRGTTISKMASPVVPAGCSIFYPVRFPALGQCRDNRTSHIIKVSSLTIRTRIVLDIVGLSTAVTRLGPSKSTMGEDAEISEATEDEQLVTGCGVLYLVRVRRPTSSPPELKDIFDISDLSYGYTQIADVRPEKRHLYTVIYRKNFRCTRLMKGGSLVFNETVTLKGHQMFMVGFRDRMGDCSGDYSNVVYNGVVAYLEWESPERGHVIDVISNIECNYYH